MDRRRDGGSSISSARADVNCSARRDARSRFQAHKRPCVAAGLPPMSTSAEESSPSCVVNALSLGIVEGAIGRDDLTVWTEREIGRALALRANRLAEGVVHHVIREQARLAVLVRHHLERIAPDGGATDPMDDGGVLEPPRDQVPRDASRRCLATSLAIRASRSLARSLAIEASRSEASRKPREASRSDLSSLPRDRT